jgi:hypothetical protein
MGQEDAQLYRYATRLAPNEFLQVWDKATSTERRDLRPLLLKKAKLWLKEAPPTDPTYQRLAAMVGPG